MILENVDLILAVACLVCILFDLASGIAKGVYQNNLSSSKMREGLFHKLGFILAIVLAVLIQWLCVLFSLPEPFVAIYPALCVWVVLTELVSVIENLCVISPQLAESPIGSLFEKEDKND